MNISSYKIDDKGEQLLELLENNSRLTPEDLSKILDIPVEQVNAYIKTFEDDNIIVRYTAQVNWERIRLEERVRALIEVKVTPEHGVGFDSIAEHIYRFEEVKSAILLSGAYDLLVYVEGESLQQVAFFVSEKLSTIKGVQSAVTHFRLKTYKENGQILVSDGESKRLPFSF
ncbi:MAG: Lrp/AsnC family transcriptional regulator [Spirochaetes bacterium]|nr:Lrp/AsnC family transcriptional regulator [Spirochaetota bacterium]